MDMEQRHRVDIADECSKVDMVLLPMSNKAGRMEAMVSVVAHASFQRPLSLTYCCLVGGNDVEMGPYNGQAGGYGQQTARDPNAILNSCRDIDRGIDTIQRNLGSIRVLQQRSLDDPDASLNTPINKELGDLDSESKALLENFKNRIKAIKQQRESGEPRNAPQVGKVDRKLKATINEYQQLESDFRKKMREQMERKFRIVAPDATAEEVRAACDDPSASQQIFRQAVSISLQNRSDITDRYISSCSRTAGTSPNRCYALLKEGMRPSR